MRRQTLFRLALLAFVALAPEVEAAPPPASPPAPGGALHLIFAGIRDGRAELGLEIALEPGWKTYWRTPGDAGIPPNFDAAHSTGIAGFDVRYPLPHRFDEAGLTGIGYGESVVLPIDLRLADPKTPATLDLAVQIGLCRDICVPLDTHLSLALDPARPWDAAAAARIAEARARLPVPAVATTLPRIVAFERHDDVSPPVIDVTVLEPAAAGEVDLLVEGPSTDWALPLPSVAMVPHPPLGRDDGRRRVWEFSLDGAPNGADLKAAPLRFTLRAGSQGVEQTVALDGTGVLP